MNMPSRNLNHLFINLILFIMKRVFTFLFSILMGATALMAQTPHSLEKVTEDAVDYWVIDTPEDFIWLTDTLSMDADGDATDDFTDRDDKWAANYRLGADITFAENPNTVDWNNDGLTNSTDALGLRTIATEKYDAEPVSHFFTGHFDGQYYTIENAYKNHTDTVSAKGIVGLFGHVDGATIENLRLLNFEFHCRYRFNAGIVAKAHGSETGPSGNPTTLRRLWVEGVINSTECINLISNSAGIVGSLEVGEISECFAKVNILTDVENKNKRQGGIVASHLGGVVKNNYSVSSITGYQQPGLIAGLSKNDGATIENCYAAGVVTGEKKVGSFAGQLKNATTSSYWDKDLQAEGVGDGGEDVIGLTTAEFGVQANFVGWDFENTWEMGTVNNVARPVLQWQDIEAGGPTSIRKIGTESLIHVFPNPTTSKLTIENAPVNARYSLVNMLGQVQQFGTIQSTTMSFDVESYSKGIYILTIGDNVNKIIIK